MSLILDGTSGLSDVDGTAGTPAIRGSDANTGVFFGADQVGIATNGVERVEFGNSETVFNDGGADVDFRVEGDTVANLLFVDASTDRVGVGTSSPTDRLTVTGGDARVNGPDNVFLKLSGAAINEKHVDFYHDNTLAFENFLDGTNNFIWRTRVGGLTERMRIDSSGGLILAGSTAQKATGTTWSNPSDERLKDNIRDYGKGLAELMQVRVREWEYNGKGGTVEGTKGLGVVADEVMVVLPDTVENYEAKLNADDEETTAIKKFDATEITWLLVKSLQELKAEFDAYKATHP